MTSFEGEKPADAVTVLGALVAAPYALAVLGIGLQALARESYPRALGVAWDTDLRPEFPHGALAVAIATFVLLIGGWMLAGLVLTVRRHRIARWVSIGWLALVVPTAYFVARRPDESRRCFFDGYSQRLVCASASTITLRDFALVTLPALAAIGCLLRSRTSEAATDAGG
ncbi:MAG: hypothetical protein JWM47_195 [Acidimicrobiales bacterium]|nr:hypothetical protein [Acidimicrobiales bacterium]